MSQPDPSFFGIPMKIAVPLITGAVAYVGGLITPWVHWWIEKKRERDKARREQIKGFRDTLSRMNDDIRKLADTSYKRLPIDFFKERTSLSPLLPHLGDNFFPNPSREFTATEIRDLILQALERVDVLEREWKLI